MDGNGVYGAVRGKNYVPVNQVIDYLEPTKSRNK